MSGGTKAAILVVGNLNVDRIYRVTRIPATGQSVPVISESTAYGGCGGNIAIACSRLGLRTYLSSVVGGDLPPGYRKRLVESGVDISNLRVLEGKHTPYCIILSGPDGSQVYAFHMGAMEMQGMQPIPDVDPSSLSFCHVTTSEPAYCRKVLERMHISGVQTGFDPGQELFFRWDRLSLSASLAYSDRFFGNLMEWRTLGDMMGWEAEPVQGKVSDLITYGEAFDHIREAVITLGPEGAVLLDRSGAIHRRAFGSADPVDTTGAGDAFRGAFYAALANGMDPGDAISMGNIMGGLVIAREGAQGHSLSWDDLLRTYGH